METEINIKGKVVKSCKQTDEKLTIVFEDGASIEVTYGSYNTSCSCHPEYEYYIDAELKEV
jgi:hypothetical protein